MSASQIQDVCESTPRSGRGVEDDELSGSEDSKFSQPSSTTSFEDASELIVSSGAGNVPNDDQEQSSDRLVSGSSSKMRTHRRSLSSPNVQVQSFVSFERPDSGFATYPRPRSAARHRLRPRSASTHIRPRPASTLVRRPRSASYVAAHQFSSLAETHEQEIVPVPEDEEKHEFVVNSAGVCRIEDGGCHELVVDRMNVYKIEEEDNHELVLSRLELPLIGGERKT